MIKKIKPDIIFVHGIEYLSFIRLMIIQYFSTMKPYKIFTDTHSLPQFTEGSVFRKVFYSIFKLLIIPYINKAKIIAFYTAEENKKLLIDFYKVSPCNVRPFLIGADLKAFFFKQDSRLKIRKELKIKDDDTLFIYTGRLCKQKGPHLLIQAVRQIKNAEDKGIVLLFIGSQEKKYFNDVFKQHLSNNFKVILLESISSDILHEYYSAADIAVFPLESTLSSLECQACKLPVIMEDNPTNVHRLKVGGLTYQRDNILDLRDKLMLLINDSIQRRKLSIEGFDYVKNNFDYHKSLIQMENILRT
jgi:glycosyltransferase involved in cell wall biosynthesis